MKTTTLLKRLLFLGTILLSSPVWADPPDPPPVPPGHGQNGDAPLGAPIDGGIGILLALGAMYGGKKLWDHHRIIQREIPTSSPQKTAEATAGIDQPKSLP